MSQTINRDDLISRKDALNLSCSITGRVGDVSSVIKACFEAYRDHIESLPPAEAKPRMTEEVREAIMRLVMCAREDCQICKYEKECSFEKQYEMATDNMHTINNAFTSSEDGWIPCSDGLPEAEYGESDCVMATCCWKSDTTKRWIEKLYYNGGNWCYPTGECFTHKVIAWKPLPEPYREDGEA